MVKMINKGLVCFLSSILFLTSTLDGCASITNNSCIANIMHKGEEFTLVCSSISGSCCNVNGGNVIKLSGITIEPESRYKFTIESDSPLYLYGFDLLIDGERVGVNSGEIEVETYFYTSDGEIFPLSYASEDIVVGKKLIMTKVNYEQMANSVLPGKFVEININNNNGGNVDIVGLGLNFSKNIGYKPKADIDAISKYFKSHKSDFDNNMLYDLIYYSISNNGIKKIFLNLSSSHADEGEYIAFLKSAFTENYK